MHPLLQVQNRAISTRDRSPVSWRALILVFSNSAPGKSSEFGLNAEGAEVFAEGRRGPWLAYKFQNPGFWPSAAIPRSLEFGIRVRRSQEASQVFVGSPCALCVDLCILCVKSRASWPVCPGLLLPECAAGAHLAGTTIVGRPSRLPLRASRPRTPTRARRPRRQARRQPH